MDLCTDGVCSCAAVATLEGETQASGQGIARLSFRCNASRTRRGASSSFLFRAIELVCAARRLSLRDQSSQPSTRRRVFAAGLHTDRLSHLQIMPHVDTAAPTRSLYPDLTRTSSQLEIACSIIGLPCNTYKHP